MRLTKKSIHSRQFIVRFIKEQINARICTGFWHWALLRKVDSSTKPQTKERFLLSSFFQKPFSSVRSCWWFDSSWYRDSWTGNLTAISYESLIQIESGNLPIRVCAFSCALEKRTKKKSKISTNAWMNRYHFLYNWNYSVAVRRWQGLLILQSQNTICS